MEITTFILGGSAVAALLVAGIKYLIKKITKTEYETLGSLVILFVVSAVISAITYGWNFLNPVVQGGISSIFIMTIALYDVLKKAVWDGIVSKIIK